MGSPKFRDEMGEAYGPLRQTYRRLARQAAERNLDVKLYFPQYLSLVRLPCYYCGLEPSNVARHSRGTLLVKYSGVDRLDNTKGYYPENCVPCCRHCNRAKSDLSEADFLQWIQRLIKRYTNVNN